MAILVALAEFLVGCLIALAGYFQLSDAEGYCRRLADAGERVPKTLRFLYPTWMYRGRFGLWQVRIVGAVTMLSSLVLFFAAISTLVSRR